MPGMFMDSIFTGDISSWDVSNVIDMRCTFHSSKFTGDISRWDVSKVKYMNGMFDNSKLEKMSKLPMWYKQSARQPRYSVELCGYMVMSYDSLI